MTRGPRGGRSHRSAAPACTHAAEDIRLWRSEALPGVEVLAAVNCTRRWRVFHETYSFCVVPRPRDAATNLAAWRYRARDAVIHNGMVGLMEPGEVHLNTCDPVGGNFWVLHLAPELLQRAAADLGIRGMPHFRALTSDNGRLFTAFGRLYAAIGESANVLEQQERLFACVLALLDTCGEGAPDPARFGGARHVMNARDYLHAHYGERVLLDELVTVSGLSRFHLVRTFRYVFGLPPHAYQNHLRVAAVARELRAGVPLAQIDSGFYDQSHLIRHFRRSYGLTPGRYASPTCAALPRYD